VTGFGVLLRKELLESWRTLRLPVVVLLFLTFGILSPLTARYLQDIIDAVAPQRFGIRLPPPTLTDAVDQLLKNTAQTGALVAILITMGSVATEKERGTAAFVLVKPVSRLAFLAAKLTVLAALLGISIGLAVGAAWIYTTILFGAPDVGGWLVLAMLVWLSTLAYASLTFVGSTVFRSSLAGAAVGFAGLIAIALASAVPEFSHYLPPGLTAVARTAAVGGGLIDIVRPLVATVAIITVCFVVAWRSFERQEL
jgi:ABC-2 type transport system permease protein